MTSIETVGDDYGEIITFYSYKGGTGRTMALSNVAYILAKQNSGGKGVLMIGCDLEAPGLHKFFFKDKFNAISSSLGQIGKSLEEVETRPGLIDLFLDLKAAVDDSDIKDEEAIANGALEIVKFESFMLKTHIPNLSLLKAGCYDEKYSDKVNICDWEDLYNKCPSLIRLFAEKIGERYKFALIDSRRLHGY